MAYEQKIIPVVTGEAAERFLDQAHQDETVNRGTIDVTDYMNFE